MSDKPKTVSVEALQDHTGFGKSHKVGDVYEVDEAHVESLRVQGKAKLAHEPEAAKPAKPSKPVTPMTTDDFKK
jgi:hypothetical protein